MKKQFVTIAVCILAAACSKAELYENTTTPQGETVTLTIPQTKVAIDGETYAFEDEDEITAVASNGSTAVLKAQGTDGTFAGTFSVPVADGSTISLYYNQTAVNQDGTAAFAQNGKPWLVSTGNSFTRTADRQISLSATLSTPEGVCAIAFVTDGTDIESIEFHTKKEIAVESFNGSGFTGGTSVSEAVLNHESANVEYKKSSIFHVPAGMEGGYWIKAVQGGQSMYKSYSSDKAVTGNTGHIISGFTPASVTVNAEFSGFQTSYSYYAGIDGVQKNISTANGMKNSEIKNGTVTVTPKFSGVSSKLVNFKSIELLLDGTKVGDAQTTAAESYTFSVPDVPEWGEKKLSVKVTYTIFDGAEISAESVESTTRYITGLPYNVSFNKNTSNWDLKKCKLQDSYLQLGDSTGDNLAKFDALSIPTGNVDVSLTIAKADLHSTSSLTVPNLSINIGGIENEKKLNGHYKGNALVWKIEYDNSYSNEKFDGTVSSSNHSIELSSGTNVRGPYIRISGLSISYR